MNVLNLVQRSPEWHAARCGSLGASRVADVLARTKVKGTVAAARANLMGELIAERLTGIPSSTYTNQAMQHGIEFEEPARRAYAFEKDVEVEEIGMILHPSILHTHASPDGFVTEGHSNGLVEIKCPFYTSHHLTSLRKSEIRSEYWVQMQWQMACSGLSWCDYVSFDPRLPIELQLYVQRVPRDDDHIEILETEVKAFLCELDDVLDDLKQRFKKEELVE